MLKTSEQPQVMVGPVAGRPAPIHTPVSINQTTKDDTVAQKVQPINFTEIAIVIGCFVAILGVLAFLFLGKDQSVTREIATISQPGQSAIPASSVTVKIPADSTPAAMEADLYFDMNKGKLRDESKELLQRYADLLKKESRWGLIVQGYTDQQGKSDYNKALGMKRADAAKKYLVELGVPESSIRVVSLGKEGAMCDDISEECRKLNRRVHLELRKNGLPVIVPTEAALPEASVKELISDESVQTAPANESGSATPESPSVSH